MAARQKGDPAHLPVKQMQSGVHPRDEGTVGIKQWFKHSAQLLRMQG
jgi:hypothetical protein